MHQNQQKFLDFEVGAREIFFSIRNQLGGSYKIGNYAPYSL